MRETTENSVKTIPEQVPIPWHVAFVVSWSSLRRRFLRSMITMFGVVLAIAFLAYMLITDHVTDAMIAADDEHLNVLLQKAGVDIYAPGQTDQMMILLIGLALLICLVGIMNAMFMSVAERVKEIGTLKCLGALDTFIVKTFLIEATLQGIAGTVLGMLLGLLVAAGISFLNYRQFVLTYFPLLGIIKSLASTLLIGTLISIAASIAPAYLAARKQPVEAMRVEE